MERQIFATFAEKNLKKNIMIMKNIVKLKINVVIQVNTEVLHMGYVIYDIEDQVKFTVDQTVLIILS